MTTNVDNPGASLEAIQYHYDVGNDFYLLWLGGTRAYSCALWEDGDTLDAAQLRKIDFHIEQARAAHAGRVLDLGCGWGSTLTRLVETHGVRHAVGLTLSQAQANWVASLKQPRIEIRVENWLDHSPTDAYDAIISIGAFEHFAKPTLSQAEKVEGYRNFFRRCRRWLKPGGRMSLQTIAYGNLRPEDKSEFIASEIFPESDLPTLADIALACEGLFEVKAVRNDRKDYERTSRVWLTGLKANRAALVDMVGAEVVAKYEKFLSLFLIGFNTGRMNLLRLSLSRYDQLLNPDPDAIA
ncbi:MAG TPA: cyclopropane-fatty-acyl-phospholipid synthase family protein [Pyrinomonadaceae bacterium]|nr:cyclopropane-fatty-acyl-phospholipid synthase family protein [Pyrinomonadaceae bacterium]